MGSLADCLGKAGLSGAQAKHVTSLAENYKQEGFSPQEAHVRAARDVLGDARAAYKSAVQQVYDSLDEDARASAFPGLAKPKAVEAVAADELVVEAPPAEKPPVEEVSGTATQGKPLKPAKKRQQKVVKTGLKGQRSIINAIQKALHIPIRYGQSKHPKFGGYFAPVQNLIVSKFANDMPAVTHEVGHKLDQMFELRKDKSIAAELDKLGDPSQSPGSRSSWRPGMSRDYKMGEGVAEFLRHWFTSPNHAKKEAPQLYAKWEAVLDEHKDLSDAMRQAQSDIDAWKKAPPEARLDSSIVTGDNPNGTKMSLDQLTRDYVDKLHYVRLASEHASRQGGQLAPSEDPYLLMRTISGSFGMAETFINHGAVDFQTRSVSMGTGLRDALRPIAGRVKEFRRWIVAKRAVELHKPTAKYPQGRDTGLVKHEMDQIAKKYANEPGFQEAFDAIKKWQNSLLKYAVDAGLLTEASAKAMRKMNRDYVPFHRLFEIGANEMPAETSEGSGRGMHAGNPASFRRSKGSRRDIIDPLETMVKNAYTIITAAEKAYAAQALAKLARRPDMGRWVEEVGRKSIPHKVTLEQIRKQLEDNGADLDAVPEDLDLEFFSKATHPDYGTNTVRILDADGKPKFYRLNAELYRAFNAMDEKSINLLTKVLQHPAHVLRAGVTLDMGFQLANLFRDAFGASILSKHRQAPFEALTRGVAAMSAGPEMAAEWAASGGKNSSEVNFYDAKAMQNWLAKNIAEKLTPAERATVIANPMSILRVMRWAASKSEEATRLGEYSKAVKKYMADGMPEGDARRLAAFESRDRQDFAKGGAQTRALRLVAAFWNAGLQSNVKIKHAFQERPAETFLRCLTFITLPTILEQVMNYDDEDYWARARWERMAFWMIPMGKDESGHTQFFRLPKPFILGQIFANGLSQALEYNREKNPDALKQWAKSTVVENIPNPSPQWGLALVENMMPQGWSFWKMKPVVPDSLADAPADLQFNAQTSEAAKYLGSILGWSPMKIDHFVEQTAGGVGKTLTGRSAPWDRFVSKPLNVSGQAMEDFYKIRGDLTREAKRESMTGERTGLGPVMRSPVEDAASQMSAYRDRAQKAETEGDTAAAAAANEKRYKIARDVSEAYDPDSDTPGAVAEYAVKKAKLGLLSSGKPKAASAVATLEERMAEFTAERQAALDWMVEHRDEPSVKQAIEDFLRSDDYTEAVGIIRPPRRQKGQNNAEWAATQAQYKRKVERREWAKKAAARLRQSSSSSPPQS